VFSGNVSNNVPQSSRLPGDINIKRDNFSFHFPLMTSLLISAILSFVMWLFRK